MRVRGAPATVTLAVVALLPACDDGGATGPGATTRTTDVATDVTTSVAGPAWREIATVALSPVGPGLRPYIVTEPAAWEALADELQIDRGGLDVDFGSDVVIVWAYGISGSCNEDEISDVAIDMDAATVTLELAGDMWESATCTDDFNQRLRVTTVRRAALPTPPFDVVLPGNCVTCRLTVDSTDL